MSFMNASPVGFVDEYSWWEKFIKDNPDVCEFSKSLKRFETEVEEDRHGAKLHK